MRQRRSLSMGGFRIQGSGFSEEEAFPPVFTEP
jgi:hypothetical protein